MRLTTGVMRTIMQYGNCIVIERLQGGVKFPTGGKAREPCEEQRKADPV